MAFYKLPERNTNTGDKSVFKLPISNSLGIEALEARNQLKNFALQYPAQYTELRGAVYVGVVKNMVELNHEIIWKLLANGKVSDKDGNEQPISATNLPNWSPKLPDQEIASISNGFAESIMIAFNEIMAKVMPDDYKGLAEDKMINIAKVNGAVGAVRVPLRGTTPQGSSSAAV